MTQGLHDNCFQIYEWLPDGKESGLFCVVTRVRAKASGRQLHRNGSGLVISPGAPIIIITDNPSWFSV